MSSLKEFKYVNRIRLRLNIAAASVLTLRALWAMV
jgi:hypothetical protein